MSGRERGRSAENQEKIKGGEEADKDETLTSDKEIPIPQWEPLENDQINILLNLPVDQVQLQFEDILDFKKHQTCLKEAALLEYFVNGFWWAKEMNFTSQQISFFMALLQQLLDGIKDNQASFSDNFKAFTQTVLATRKSNSTEAIASFLFNTDQIKTITDYFKTSLFQHYRLYELLFSHRREEQLLKTEKCIELINPADFAAPLEEGMPTDLYFHYVALPRAQTPEKNWPLGIGLSEKMRFTCFSFSEETQICFQGKEESLEENMEEAGKTEPEERLENHMGFSVEDVQEVLREMTQEMLAKLQADFTEKLRVHEETYISRLERLQKGSSK